MATAQKVCAICGKRYDARLRRKTCSTECFLQLTTDKGNEQNAKVLRKKRDPATQTEPLYTPTPKEIAHLTALMRSGKLVVTPKGAIYS